MPAPTYSDFNQLVVRMQHIEAWHYQTVVGVCIVGIMCGLMLGFVVGKYFATRPEKPVFTSHSGKR